MRSRRHERIADEASRHGPGTNLDARAIDAFLLHKILASVECALGACLGVLVRRRVADHDKRRAGLLLHRKRNIVEAALRFVVYTRRTAAVTLEAYVAEVLCLRDCRCRRRSQRDLRIRLRGLPEVVDDVTCHSDCGGLEPCG